MKAILAVAVLFLAAGASGGSIYDEKGDITKEVTTKYDEVIALAGKVVAEVDDEKKKEEKTAADEAKEEGTNRNKESLEQFQKDAIAATRSAIARGKPVQAIDCIVKVKADGEKLIKETLVEYTKAVDDVKVNRDKELDVDRIEADLIKTATAELKVETLEKIKAEKNPNALKTLRADALKKAATAKKQLEDIETRIVKPVLKERYKKLKQGIANRFKEVVDGLRGKLQKCIN